MFSIFPIIVINSSYNEKTTNKSYLLIKQLEFVLFCLGACGVCIMDVLKNMMVAYTISLCQPSCKCFIKITSFTSYNKAMNV